MGGVRGDVLELSKRLISIESHLHAAAREAAVGLFLAEWFRERGIEVEMQPVLDGRANVIARLPGGDGPSLMLCGHLDTVPAGDMAGAFDPRVDGNLLWGRGACDMKGAVAAMVCVLAETKRAQDERGATLTGDLLFAGTVDEETGGLGVKALVDSGLRTDFAVVGEPTDLRVALAHKGACFARITLVGRGAHGSCPEKGVSAVSYAARIVREIETILRPRLATRTHKLLGCSTVNVGRVCGGTQPNIVAERCEIEIDRRMIPGDREPLAEIRALVDATCGGVEGLESEVIEMPMTSIVPHTALETAADSTLAAAAGAAAREAGLSEPVFTGVTYWTDGGHLAANGIETVILGPGDIAYAHGPREHVEIAQLDRAAEVYRGIVARLLLDGT